MDNGRWWGDEDDEILGGKFVALACVTTSRRPRASNPINVPRASVGNEKFGISTTEGI